MNIRNFLIGSVLAAGIACTNSSQTALAPAHGGSGAKRTEATAKNGQQGLTTADESSADRVIKKDESDSDDQPPEKDQSASENGQSSKSSTGKQASETSSSDPNVVEFTIPAGTGRKAWNSPSNPIRVKQGQTLVVKNGDSQKHWIHTNFSPFPHPFQGIPPGQSARYRINGSNASGMRDHLTLAPIYMTVTR